MKIHFEQIGRDKKTFDAAIDDALLAKCKLKPKSKNRYGDTRILCALCEQYDFLRSQVRGCMMSTPDFDMANDGTHIGVFAGFHLVGKAWLVRDTATNGKKGGEA